MGEKYAIWLQLYLVMFVLVAGWVRSKMRMQQQLLRDGNIPSFLFLGFVIAFLLRGYMASEVLGFANDVATFTNWAQTAARNLPRFYENVGFCDYPPLYIYVLAVVGKLMEMRGLTNANVFLIKLPAILADLAIAFVFYRIAIKHIKKDVAAVLAILIALNPASILNSAIWGQVDSVFALLLLLAIWSIRTRPIILSSVYFALLVMLKPQAVFFMPILLYELIRRKKWQDWLYALLAGLATVCLVALPFSRDPMFMINLYMGTAEGYKYASLNAFNLFSLFGFNLATDNLKVFLFSHSTWGIILDVALVIWAGMLYVKSKAESAPIFIAVLLNVGAYMVSVRMHERYMFPVIALLPILYVFQKDKRLLDVWGLLMITFTVGVHDVLYRMITLDYPHISPDDRLLFLLSAMNLAGFVWIGIQAHKQLLPGKLLEKKMVLKKKK